MTKPAIITTSWDDGHAMDSRLGGLLARHGLVGTFYIPVSFAGNETDIAILRDLRDQGHECGAHTMTHRLLHQLDAGAMEQEIRTSKHWLEDRLGSQVTAFCYPGGHAPRTAQRIVKASGFLLGRTTQALRTDAGTNPFRMPVTAQCYPHPWHIHARHALKEGNLAGLGQWLTRFGLRGDLDGLVDAALARLRRHGGVLHLWGHSWEIDALGWWDRLDSLCARIAHLPGISYLDNTGTVRAQQATR